MGVDVKLGGAPSWNTSVYSIQEDATPLDPSGSSGGYGQFSVTTTEMPNDKMLTATEILISDGAQGITSGTISKLSAVGDAITITGDSTLGRLNVTVTALPYNGTLGGAFAYYLSLAGITTNYLVDEAIASNPIILKGWRGNLYDRVRELATSQQVEMAYVSDMAILRMPRTNTAINYRNSDINWDLDNTNIAQSVTMYYYEKRYDVHDLAFPFILGDTDASITQVDANQTVTFTLDLKPNGELGLGASLSTVEQPVAVDDATLYYNTQSAYTVIGNDNAIYPATDWVANGGVISVVIGDDTESLIVTVVGPNDPGLSPFRIALPVDSTNQKFYPTLKIFGAGVFYEKKLLTTPTGNTIAETAVTSNQAIDNEAIGSLSEAFSATMSAYAAAEGPRQTIGVTTKGINTNGVNGSYSRLTMGQWDDIWGGGTFDAWDNQFGGGTFAVADDYLISLVSDDFDNQAFGNVAGARVYNDYCFYRISSANISESEITYTASADTIMQDWDDVFAGGTFGDWDDIWQNYRFVDYAPTPLKNIAVGSE